MTMASRVAYWRGDGGLQNFGDFLTEFFRAELFLPASVQAEKVHLVGSVIDDHFFNDLTEPARVAFWGCGLRTPDGLSEWNRRRSEILSVRGPLTRSALRLGSEVPFGDPGFLLPALHSPRAAGGGGTLCVPHFSDRRSDEEILERSGCAAVLRTAVPASVEAVRHTIDRIVGADFVLTASLHGAVVAAAYGRPYAPWSGQRVDLPFKWADLAASLSLPDRFASTLSEGREVWSQSIAPKLRLPAMWDVVAVAPFAVRPDALLRVAALEVARGRMAADAPGLLAAAEAQRSGQRYVGERSGWISGSGVDGATWVSAALRRSEEERAEALGRASESRREAAERGVAAQSADVRAREAEEARAAAEEARARAETDRVAAHRALEALRGDVERATQEVVASREELASTRATLAERGRERDAARVDRDSTKDRLDSLRAELDGVRRELAASQALLDERTEERDAARTEARTLRQSWSARLSRVPSRVGHAAAVVGRLARAAVGGHLAETLRLRTYARLIRRSWLFDEQFYLAQVPDETAARRDPIGHFLESGAAAGLDPNPFFDTTYYVERHPTVARYGKNPLVHYIRYGAREGLSPSASFDAAYYLAHCPFAASSGIAPLSHFLVHGRAAGFPPAPPPERRPAAPADASAARDTSSLLLVVDHRMVTPDQDSGSLRMFGIIKLLAGIGHRITFVSDATAPMPEYEAALRPYVAGVLYGLDATRSHLEAEGGRYRHALLSRPDQAQRYLPSVRALAPNATVAFDTVDVHWVRMMRAAELTGDEAARAEAERLRRVERNMAERADLVLAITDQERAVIESEAPTARVAVLPNVHEVRASAPGPTGRSGLVFIGGFEHAPNVDAVTWFAREILPRIQREIPEVTFTILGSKPTEEVLRLESPCVHVTGFVPQVEPHFDRGRVFVSPLRYGAGMKGKIGQAMSLGLPVVTTSVGAEGMRLLDGRNALVADSPQDFAAAVVRLYRDGALWEDLSRSALRHVDELFSERRVRETLKDLFPVPSA